MVKEQGIEQQTGPSQIQQQSQPIINPEEQPPFTQPISQGQPAVQGQPVSQSQPAMQVQPAGAIPVQMDGRRVYTQPATGQPHYDYVPKPKKPIDWDKAIALWLPRIFIIVFLIGVLWGFTAAVNAGWINEPMRCLLGIVVAGFMFFLGERQVQRERFALGQVLLGGSIAVLMLSLFSAHMLYHLIPSTLAFILYILAIWLGIFSAARHKSEALMIVMMVGGYLVPALVDSANPNLPVLISYETLFSIAMILLAHKFAYRITLFIAYFLLQIPLLLSYTFFDGSSDYKVWFLAGVITQHIALLALFTWRSESRMVDRSIILYTSFGILVGWGASLYQGQPWRYPTLLIAFTALYAALAWWRYRTKQPYELYISIATIGAFFWLTNVLHAGNRGSALVAEGTLALLLGIRFKSALQQVTAIVVLVIGFLHVIANPIERFWSPETMAWAVLVAAILALYMAFGKMQSAKSYAPLRPLLAWLDAVIFLVFLSQAVLAASRSLDADYRHLILSASWTAYAVGMIIFGIQRHKRAARMAGIIFLLFVLLKVIFIDLPFVSIAVRAILFLGLGGIGVAVSRLFYKKQPSETDQPSGTDHQGDPDQGYSDQA